MTFKFPNPILGFGFNILGLDALNEYWQFTVDGNNFNVADVIDASNDTTNLSGFAGFRSDSAISSITVPGLPFTSGSPINDVVGFTGVFVAEESMVAVPEPSTLALLGVLALCAGIYRLRYRRFDDVAEVDR